MKSLILYYSRTGNTANVAEVIHKSTKSDIEEVKDRADRSGVIGYIKAGKDTIFGAEADIEGIKSDINNYGSIFIGGPVWVMKPATPVTTLIKRLDLKNKQVVLFVTCGGNPGKSLEVMSDLVMKNGGLVLHRFFIKTGKLDAAGVVQAAQEEVAKLKQAVSKNKTVVQTSEDMTV
ncbi:hypothetical protein FJZ53_02675 [Candidatus Woesearchaeota archaeon]|nr:hypothetical protein [Candidatus Woesearchaeota archaeon]